MNEIEKLIAKWRKEVESSLSFEARAYLKACADQLEASLTRASGEPSKKALDHAYQTWLATAADNAREEMDEAIRAAYAIDGVRPAAPAPDVLAKLRDMLERFEKSPARGMVSDDYALGYREAIEHALDDLDGAAPVRDVLADAVAAEREACAKIAGTLTKAIDAWVEH